MTIKYYNSLDERKQLLLDANSLGETMIHDDFIDKNDKPTDGNSGKLILEIIPNPDDTLFKRIKELNQKLDDDVISFNEFKELYRLQH